MGVRYGHRRVAPWLPWTGAGCRGDRTDYQWRRTPDPASAAAVTLGETIAYLGRDATFHPLAAVDQGPVDLRAQLLGAARPLWSTLIADEQFAPGTSAQQPAGLVLVDRGTRYLVRREFGALPAVPDTDKREPGLTRWIWDPAIGRVASLSKVTTAPQFGVDRFAILEVA